MSSEPDITRLLERWQESDSAAQQSLLLAVLPDLKKIGANVLARQGGPAGLQTTELVHEAYIKLVGQRNQSWQNRAHFFAIIARLMRRIIIDHARSRGSEKRGGQAVVVDLDLDEIPVPANYPDWIELDQAMVELEAINPDAARVVDLRHVLGLSVDEAAEALGVGTATVGRYWRFARAWLAARLDDHGPHDDPPG